MEQIGTLTISDFHQLIDIFQNNGTKPDIWNWKNGRLTMRVRQQKYRPLKRECPMTKRNEGSKVGLKCAKRLWSVTRKIDPKGKNWIKNYSFMKRIIKTAVR